MRSAHTGLAVGTHRTYARPRSRRRHGRAPRAGGCAGDVRSAPLRRGADVLDVAGRTPGPGAVGQQVPAVVAVDVVALGLAEDVDDLAVLDRTDDAAAAGRLVTEQQVRLGDDASLVGPLGAWGFACPSFFASSRACFCCASCSRCSAEAESSSDVGSGAAASARWPTGWGSAAIAAGAAAVSAASVPVATQRPSRRSREGRDRGTCCLHAMRKGPWGTRAGLVLVTLGSPLTVGNASRSVRRAPC